MIDSTGRDLETLLREHGVLVGSDQADAALTDAIMAWVCDIRPTPLVLTPRRLPTSKEAETLKAKIMATGTRVAHVVDHSPLFDDDGIARHRDALVDILVRHAVHVRPDEVAAVDHDPLWRDLLAWVDRWVVATMSTHSVDTTQERVIGRIAEDLGELTARLRDGEKIDDSDLGESAELLYAKIAPVAGGERVAWLERLVDLLAGQHVALRARCAEHGVDVDDISESLQVLRREADGLPGDMDRLAASWLARAAVENRSTSERGVKVFFERRDWWIGYYRGDRHHYVCPLPTLVIRWPRRGARS